MMNFGMNFGSWTMQDCAKGFYRGAGAYDRLIKKGLDRAGMIVLREAKILCPVGETGNLRASTRKTELTSEKVVLSSLAPYAIYVHEGTSRMKKRPYLTNAAKVKDKDVDQALDITMDMLIKEILK